MTEETKKRNLDGFTYINPEVFSQSEDAEAAHMCLDDNQVPRKSETGETYSLWGRILQFSDANLDKFKKQQNNVKVEK